MSGCKSEKPIETSAVETVDEFAVNQEIKVNNSSNDNLTNGSDNSNSANKDNENVVNEAQESLGSAWERESLANQMLDESIAAEAESESIALEESMEPFDVYGIYQRTEGENIIIGLYDNENLIEYSIDSTKIEGGVDELYSGDEIIISTLGRFDETGKVLKDVFKITNYTQKLKDEEAAALLEFEENERKDNEEEELSD